MDKLYIVIPAYNEQDNIEQVINDWYPVIEKHNGDGQSRLVIIDDGSKDSTYEKLKQYAKTRPLLTPLTKPRSNSTLRIQICVKERCGLYFSDRF